MRLNIFLKKQIISNMKFSSISQPFINISRLNKLKFQTIGNLYLNNIEKDTLRSFVKPYAPNLIVTGNVCNIDNLVKFCEHLSFNYDKVFFVPGIMELSNNNTKYTVNELVQIIELICNRFNIIPLSNSSYNWTDYDLEIVGSTYWGKVVCAKSFINSISYSNMYGINKDNMSPKTIRMLHEESVKYLSNLNLQTNKLLITHYPIYATNQFDNDGIQYVPFTNNINNIIRSVDKLQVLKN
jgi:hypothetical protein